MKGISLFLTAIILFSCSASRTVNTGIYSYKVNSNLTKKWIQIYLHTTLSNSDSALFLNADNTFKWNFLGLTRQGFWTANGKEVFLYSKKGYYKDSTLKTNEANYKSPDRLKITKSHLTQMIYLIYGKRGLKIKIKYKLNTH